MCVAKRESGGVEVGQRAQVAGKVYLVVVSAEHKVAILASLAALSATMLPPQPRLPSPLLHYPTAGGLQGAGP